MKKSGIHKRLRIFLIVCILSAMIPIHTLTAAMTATHKQNPNISLYNKQILAKTVPPAPFFPKYKEPTEDEAAWLFQSSKVVRVNLEIPEESIQALWVDARTYVPATFSMTDGEKSYGPWQIEVKLKGWYGSFRDLNGKSAFKLKFPNKSERISGLKKLTLNNMVQDSTNIHEVLAYDLFRSLGIPAPRTGFAVVSVNGMDYGLHLNVETLDDVSLPKWFGDVETGHLYEGSYGDWWGDMNDPFSGHYEVDEGDEEDRSDLAALLAAANVEGESWLSAVDAVTDLDQMILMWAAEHYIGHWDGYSYSLGNNYYLHSTVDGEFTMLPWGTDQTFISHISFEEMSGGLLWRRCMTNAICRADYAEALVVVRDKVNALNLIAKGAALHHSLVDEIQRDTRKEYSVDDSKFWRNYTLGFLASRSHDLDDWLATLPAAPSNVQVGFASKEATLTWTPSQTAGPSLLVGYRIQYRKGSDAWSSFDVLNPAASTAQIKGLQNGSTYKFRVSSLTSSGALSHSPIVSRVIGTPDKVSSLIFERDSIKNQITVYWGLPESFEGIPVRFEVQYKQMGTDTWMELWNKNRDPFNDEGTRRLVIKNLADDQTYMIRIRIHTNFGSGSWDKILSFP